MHHDVIVGLGSNIEAQKHIEQTLNILQKKYPELRHSQKRTTAPIGFKDQDDFINLAVRFYTGLERDALKCWLKSIEATLGRERTPNKDGPRTIDLDILIWDGNIVDDDVHTRPFLQSSIQELCPGLLQSKIGPSDIISA